MSISVGGGGRICIGTLGRLRSTDRIGRKRRWMTTTTSLNKCYSSLPSSSSSSSSCGIGVCAANAFRRKVVVGKMSSGWAGWRSSAIWGLSALDESVTPPTVSSLSELYRTAHRRREEVRSREDESAQILASSPLIEDGDDDGGGSGSGSVRAKMERLARRLGRWARSILDALLVTARGAEVVLRLSPLLLLTPGAMLWNHCSATAMPATEGDGGGGGAGRKNPLSDAAWRYTLYTLQSLGPAFVKLSQWAATRRDLFPPRVCDRLGTLHDSAFVHPWHHTRSILTEAFGDYEAKGLHVDPNDIVGSGSAAQVYRGTLRIKTNGDELGGGSGRGGAKNEHDGDEATNTTFLPVAVKVLHPNIHHSVERDLLLMKRAASLLDSIPLALVKMLSLPRAAENFASIMRKQVDLAVEGANLDAFRDNFSSGWSTSRSGRGIANNGASSEDVPKVSFPRPIEGWVDSNVLVEEFISDATPITAYLLDSSDAGMVLRKELAGPLLRAFLKMVFTDNFVHCDLHPGNVLVRTTVVNSPSSALFSKVSLNSHGTSLSASGSIRKHTIVFLDAGIATSLSPRDQRNLRDLFRAVILNDGERAGRLMVERARYERCSQVEGGVDAFAKGVGSIVSEFHDRRKKGLTLGAVRIGSLLGRVLDLCRIHGVEIDPAMASIVVSTLVLEGLGRSLEPDMNLIDCALPFVLGRGQV